MRLLILKRDNFTCVYCDRKHGKYVPPEVKSAGNMHIDHVIPVTKNGTNNELNLVTSCSVCNMYKGNRTPDECGLWWPVVNGIKLGEIE